MGMLSLLSSGNYCLLFIVSLYFGAWMTSFIFQKVLQNSSTSHFLCSKKPRFHYSEFQETSWMFIGQQSHRPVASLANQPLYLCSVLVLGQILHHYLAQSTISSFRGGWEPRSAICIGHKEDGKLGLGKNETHCQICLLLELKTQSQH